MNYHIIYIVITFHYCSHFVIGPGLILFLMIIVVVIIVVVKQGE